LTLSVSVEHESSIYHPRVISATSTSTFPFSHPVASIKCVAEKHFRVDDIVRIGDIFHGRIINLLTDGHTMQISCRGHSQELNHKYVTGDYTQTGVTSGDVLEYLIYTYLTRLTSGTLQGDTITSFNISANQANIYDVVKNLEVYDSNHRLQVVTQYTDNHYTSSQVNWLPLPTVSNLILSHNSAGVLGANYKAIGTEIRNKIYIFGSVSEDPATGISTQKYGFAEDTPSQNKYGVREFPYCDHALDDDAMCTTMAQGLVNQNSMPKLNGSVTMAGTIIYPGDLVTCDFDMYLDGERFEGEYRVVRVDHRMSPWLTTVTLGQYVKSEGEVIADSVNNHRLNNLNSIL